MEYYVFVYGTLLKNERNHHLLNDATYVGNGYIENYYMINLGTYPGILPGIGKVLGEVYKINEHTLKDLDNLEEEGTLYERKMVTIKLENDYIVAAYIYEYILNHYPKLVDLSEYDWKSFKHSFQGRVKQKA